ncbi:hypothetical protein L209DRAFT_91314 [Thermothelomyces heterothallicus CBS 203.75]
MTHFIATPLFSPERCATLMLLPSLRQYGVVYTKVSRCPAAISLPWEGCAQPAADRAPTPRFTGADAGQGSTWNPVVHRKRQRGQQRRIPSNIRQRHRPTRSASSREIDTRQARVAGTAPTHHSHHPCFRISFDHFRQTMCLSKPQRRDVMLYVDFAPYG